MIYRRMFPLVRRRGFTLLEIMVVTGISVMLMTVGALVYSSCLSIYRQSQGLTDMYQTSKILSRDLKDYLGSVVPLKGKWIHPIGKGPGMTVAVESSAMGDTGALDKYYLMSPDWLTPARYESVKEHDDYFSWAQHQHHSSRAVNTVDEWKMALGNFRSNVDPISWGRTRDSNMSVNGWWMPAFFGRRAASSTEATEADNVMAGSWGWPRPDYRLDADARELAIGDNTANVDSGGNLACWFYAEERYFNSAYTLALDNANIVLISLKFSRKVIGGKESTKLSFLRHQILGFDIATQTKLRADHAYGNMLRSIKIVPYYINNGDPAEMDDNALGWRLNGGGVVAGGDAVPSYFDIFYNLRNPGNLKRHKFALRVYQFGNPQ